jgi:hypothetical protein
MVMETVIIMVIQMETIMEKISVMIMETITLVAKELV